MIQTLIRRFEPYALKISLNNSKKKERLYILPTKAGCLFIGVNFTLFLMGLTYANNLVLLLSFSLLAALLLIMFHTHSLLEEWKIQKARFQDGSENEGLFLSLYPSENAPEVEIHTDKGVFPGRASATRGECAFFKIEGAKRGKYNVAHLKLWTTGAYGFFYVWTYKKTSLTARVYPGLLKASIPVGANLNELFNSTGEFRLHLPYEQGGQAKRIDWKAYAKTDQLLVKDFQDQAPGGLKIDQADWGEDKEIALSKMAWLVNFAAQNQLPWEISGDSFFLPLNQGLNHWRQSMECLSEA